MGVEVVEEVVEVEVEVEAGEAVAVSKFEDRVCLSKEVAVGIKNSGEEGCLTLIRSRSPKELSILASTSLLNPAPVDVDVDIGPIFDPVGNPNPYTSLPTVGSLFFKLPVSRTTLARLSLYWKLSFILFAVT